MPFLPDFSQAQFNRNERIDNPYLPLVPGTVSAFSGSDGETTEGNDFFVTSLNYDVLGVDTTVIRDTAYEEGLLVEETLDFYAQDSAGNVWYFGEVVINYRYDEDGNFIGTDSDGAWLAGIDNAQPGWIMPDNPYKDFSYYNEFAPGVALDEARALGRAHIIETDLGVFQVLKTLDTSELDAGIREFKYYSLGIGLVRADEGLDENNEPEFIVELRDTIVAPSSDAPAGSRKVDNADFVSDGANRWITFLGENSDLSGAVGYYTYDLATGKIGEGRILAADFEDVATGEAFKIKGVPAGRGIGLFFVPRGADLGVDLADYEEGGLFFMNMLTGRRALLSDGMAPVVTDVDGHPLPISVFHALGAAHKANLLNPGLGYQAVEWLPDDDAVIEIGFEDRRQTEAGFDGDFDDFRFAFGAKPVDPADYVIRPEVAFAPAASEAVALPAPEALDLSQRWLDF